MKLGGNNKKRSITRRDFLRTSSLAAGAASLAPVISAPFVSRALADNKSLSIVQLSHFVPEYETWFDKFYKEWGEKDQRGVAFYHIPVQDVPERAAAVASAQLGHEIIELKGA